MTETCRNCGRDSKQTRMLRHHTVLRELNGTDDPHNRMPLCSACERFIHFRYTNNTLAKLKEKILLEKDVRLFGAFVNTSSYKRRADVKDIKNDFDAWKSKKAMGGQVDALD